jgi:hypothetical protein
VMGAGRNYQSNRAIYILSLLVSPNSLSTTPRVFTRPSLRLGRSHNTHCTKNPRG